MLRHSFGGSDGLALPRDQPANAELSQPAMRAHPTLALFRALLSAWSAELTKAVASSPEVFAAAFIDAIDFADEAALRSHELGGRPDSVWTA